MSTGCNSCTINSTLLFCKFAALFVHALLLTHQWCKPFWEVGGSIKVRKELLTNGNTMLLSPCLWYSCSVLHTVLYIGRSWQHKKKKVCGAYQWFRQAARGRCLMDMKCTVHNLEVIGVNTGWCELGVCINSV